MTPADVSASLDDIADLVDAAARVLKRARVAGAQPQLEIEIAVGGTDMRVLIESGPAVAVSNAMVSAETAQRRIEIKVAIDPRTTT